MQARTVATRLPFLLPASTRVGTTDVAGVSISTLVDEFWTSRQRQASSLHEVSYRACFKPQLPRFFIERLTEADDRVYDPFSGRGTTAVEAALLGRKVAANDANPLAAILAAPRIEPPTLDAIEERLSRIPSDPAARADQDLSMFYERSTEAQIVSLLSYLLGRAEAGTEDPVDRWIRMVATNRLTGHSSGFFSAYTLPPNQAVTPNRQRKINERLGQRPEPRDVRRIILKKSRQLLADVTAQDRQRLRKAAKGALFSTADARATPAIKTGSVQLVVTSPPFLDVVQYSSDNWLRCWFNGIDADAVASRITMARTLETWRAVMADVLRELHRVVAAGGWVAFEVGEVRNGRVRLEDEVVPAALEAGFAPQALLLNEQSFTKTSNIWGVSNNRRGTNTNRIVLLRKERRGLRPPHAASPN